MRPRVCDGGRARAAICGGPCRIAKNIDHAPQTNFIEFLNQRKSGREPSLAHFWVHIFSTYRGQ
jgi:hypothetical protein